MTARNYRGYRDGRSTTAGLTGAIVFFSLLVPQISAQTPQINLGGVVNAASYATGVTPGSIASVYGSNFGSSISGVTVKLNGISAPLLSVSSTVINFQVPWELAGQLRASVTVTLGTATSSPVTAALVTAGPGLFTMNAAAQGAIQIANTATLVAAQGDFPDSRPANTGEFISIYATGLGPVLTQPATGVPPASPSDTVTTPIVTIGDVPAVVTFSGAVPGFLGLYVVNVQVPSNTPTGPMVPLVLSMAGAAANAVGIAIASPLAPIYVSSCQTLTGPGTYVLTTDLSSTDAPCLVVGGANVQLDCAGHKATTQAAASVSAVSVSGVSGLGVRNCTIRANSTTNVTLAYPGLAINGSNQVFVAGNDIQWVNVSGSSSSLWFESNHITVSLYTFGASGLVVQGNIIENPGRVDEGAMISLGGGSGNQILNNSIDGGWDHGADQTGTDDGIFLSDDTGDTVVGNIIQNVYDAGIEALGSLRNSLIGDNVIQYAENNGIASYYGTTWSSNIVRYNQVSLSPTCVFIEYIGKEVVDGTVINLRPSNEYEFHDNSFVNNVFRNGVGLSTQFSIEVVFPTDLPSDLANNLIMGNDLGPGSSPPALAPAAAFVDGGGNICGAGLSPVIKCTSP